MHKQIRLFTTFLKADLQSYLEYRLGSLIWIVNGAIGPILALFIWLVISSQTNLALSSSQLVTYFFLSILVTRLTQVWTLEQMGDLIKSGEISNMFLKPYHYVIENLSEQIGQKASRLMALIPVLLLLGLILKSNLNFQYPLWRIALFLVSLVLGFTVIFILEHTLALLAFWIDEIHGIARIHSTLGGLFSGTAIPLVFMPGALKSIMKIYPARFTASFPLEILVTNQNSAEILWGFIICLSEIGIFYILYRKIFKLAVRKYSAVGR